MLRRYSPRKKNRRPLGRSKSASSVRPDAVRRLESIEPELAVRDARIAALLAHGRPSCSRGHSPCCSSAASDTGLHRSNTASARYSIARSDSHRSGMASETQQPDALQRQKSIRFAGPNAQPRRKLGTSHTDGAWSTASKSPKRGLGDTLDTRTLTDTGTRQREEGVLSRTKKFVSGLAAPYSSQPSLLPRLHKSKSMWATVGDSHPDIPIRDSSVRGRPWFGSGRLSSTNNQNQPKAISKAPSFRSLYDVKTRLPSNDTEKDLAIQRARVKLQDQVHQQTHLKRRPSFFSRSRSKNTSSSGGFRHSLRNTSGTSNAQSTFSTDSVIVSKHSLRRTTRKISSSLKRTFKGLFHPRSSDTADIDISETHVLAAPQPFASPGSDAESPPQMDDRPKPLAQSLVSQHVPALHNVSSAQKIRSRQGSVEDLTAQEHMTADERSRVTSWTNSVSNTVGSRDITASWEKKRLSVINEHGVHPSRPPLVVDSQRVYSALMEKARQDHRQVVLERARRACDTVGRATDYAPLPTIRCVRDEDDVFVEQKLDKGQETHNKAGPEDDTGVVKSESVKNLVEKTDNEKGDLSGSGSPKPTSERASALLASPTYHAFRSTSPYRRAIQESMQKAEQVYSGAANVKYLRSLSNFSLPTRQLSIVGSDQEAPFSCASSHYSFDVDNQTVPHSSQPSAVKPNTRGQGPPPANVAPSGTRWGTTPVRRDMSAASSVEWKTQLSAHVSRMEDCTVGTDGKGGDLTPGRPPYARHIREVTEIEPSSPTGIRASSRLGLVGTDRPTLKKVDSHRVFELKSTTAGRGTAAGQTTDENVAPKALDYAGCLASGPPYHPPPRSASKTNTAKNSLQPSRIPRMSSHNVMGTATPTGATDRYRSGPYTTASETRSVPHRSRLVQKPGREEGTNGGSKTGTPGGESQKMVDVFLSVRRGQAGQQQDGNSLDAPAFI